MRGSKELLGSVVTQLFVYKNNDGPVRMLLSNITDDILFAGPLCEVEGFSQLIEYGLQLSRVSSTGNIISTEARYERTNGATILCIWTNTLRIPHQSMSQIQGKKHHEAEATSEENDGQHLQ